MAFTKGTPKPENSGRRKGTPNKVQQTLQDKAAELGVDPFEILLHFAKGDWKTLGYKSSKRLVNVTDDGTKIYEDVISPQLRQKSAKDASEYLYPKRRSIEVSDPNGNDPFQTFAKVMAGIADLGDE